jgi:hypothetical protein
VAYWWFPLVNALAVVTALVVDAGLRTDGLFSVLTLLAIAAPSRSLPPPS